jgi:hypothetical protein
VNPGEILLIGVALIVSGWAVSSWRRGSRVAREQRAREKIGAENAARAEREVLAEVCAACGEPVDHAVDLFDEKSRRWWHKRCWRETVT